MGQLLQHLNTTAFNRNAPDFITFKRERGHFTHLLIVLQGTTIRFGDNLTSRFRRDGGKALQNIDDISLDFFANMTDLKFALPSYGSVFKSDQGNGAGTTENESNGNYIAYGVNAVLIPLGSLYLDKAELEVALRTVHGGSSVSGANATNDGTGASFVHFFGIDTGPAPAHILMYEKSYDLEAKHTQVREMFLAHKTGETLFPSASPLGDPNYVDDIRALDVRVQIDIDGDSNDGNLYGYGAMTSIFGELNRPASSYVRIFQDSDDIPSELWLKVSGNDRNQVDLITVKEEMIPMLTLEGHAANISKELKKTEALEKSNPEAARAYQAAGLAKPSEALAEVKQQLPAAI